MRPPHTDAHRDVALAEVEVVVEAVAEEVSLLLARLMKTARSSAVVASPKPVRYGVHVAAVRARCRIYEQTQ